MLINFLTKNKTISFLGCATQMFLFLTCGTTEYFILAAMAYDRYVAIYNPLLYLVKMSPRVYVPLIISCYVVGILHATLHTVATVTLSFCASNEIRHVFCNIPPLLVISCSDTNMNQLDCSDLLWFHSVGHSEDAFCWREKKSIFYMWFSPNRSVHFSWYNSLHVHVTQFQLCLGSWHDRVHILHHHNSHAEYHHL